MKRVFSVLAIIFCTVQLFASELVIRGEVDVPFSVYINGEKYYSYYSQVTVSNLIRGTYRVEIYTESARQELLYDCRIDVPRNSRVVATFTGDNHIYVSSNKYTKPVTIVTVAYPHRVVHSEPVRVAPKGHPKPAPVKPATSSNNKSGVHGEVRNTNSTRSSKPASTSTSTPKTSTEKSASTRTSSSSSSSQVKSSTSSSSSNSTTRTSSTRSSSSSSDNNTGSRTTQSTR